MFSKLKHALLNPLPVLILSALFLYFLVLLTLDSPWFDLTYNLANLLLAVAVFIAGLLLFFSPGVAIVWFIESLPASLSSRIEIKEEISYIQWMFLRLMGLIAMLVSIFAIYTSVSGLIGFLLSLDR
jgi:hypothetical protein